MSRNHLTRRRLVLGATAATAALTGCLGGGTTDDGSEASPTSTPTSEPRTTTPTATATPAPTASDATATPAESVGTCAPWTGGTTPYEVAGTPFFFGWDHVSSWTPEGITQYSRGSFVRFISPSVGEDDFALTLRVSQDNVALTAAERDEEIEARLNFEAEPNEVVDEITYDGETVRVLGTVEEEYPFYQPGLAVFLPQGSGEDRRYYGVGAVLYDGMAVAEADQQACISAAEAAQSAVIQSLAPNPDTTFEGGER